MSDFKGELKLDGRKLASEELAERALEEIRLDSRRAKGHLFIFLVFATALILVVFGVIKVEKGAVGTVPEISLNLEPIEQVLSTDELDFLNQKTKK